MAPKKMSKIKEMKDHRGEADVMTDPPPRGFRSVKGSFVNNSHFFLFHSVKEALNQTLNLLCFGN